MSTIPKPLALVILDGWGYSETPQYNAIAAASKPVWDRLWNDNPHTLIRTSGAAVGLPKDQMGNSEVGHLNLGAGRVVYQNYTRINKAISDGEFFRNPAFTGAVDKAIARIQSGQRIFIGSSSGEPQHLVKGLADASLMFTDLEIVRLFGAESTSLSRIADRSKSQNLNIRSFYLGSANSDSFKGDLRFITPINLSEIDRLIKSRMLPIQVALIQVTPPDDFGWMSLGISVDVTAVAAEAADLVIAQVNTHMPRVLGRSFIHVNDVDLIVQYKEDLISIQKAEMSDTATLIGRQISRLITDGATIQVGLDAASQATVQALFEKNDP